MQITVMGYTFGEGHDDFELTDVEMGLGEVRSSDLTWPLRGGTRPGVSYLEAGSITLSAVTPFGINDESAADSALGRFLSSWRKALAAGPGVLLPMTVTTPAKTRVVYGRPDRIDLPEPGSTSMEQGIAELTALFKVHDPLVYSSSPVILSLSVVPKSLGGIVAPIVTPVKTTLTSGVEYRQLVVPGDAPAPLKVTFHGPAKDPVVTVAGTTIGISGSILYDEEVIVNGRDRTVTYSDGRQAASKLTRKSRIDKFTAEPGTHEVSFTATDRTGTARITVEATPAYYHI